MWNYGQVGTREFTKEYPQRITTVIM